MAPDERVAGERAPLRRLHHDSHGPAHGSRLPHLLLAHAAQEP